MSIYDVNGNIIPTGGGGDNGGRKFPWLNIAHKGTAPEQYGNSIYSINRSHELGMDGIEIDVRMTADDVIVLSHDAEVVGTDSQGNTQTLTIINSNYSDLASLTLFSIDGVDYHIITLNEVLRMAFNWKMFVQLDHKSQANTVECSIKCSELVRDNGMIGNVLYSGWHADPDLITANDPLAKFYVGASTDIPSSEYADIPLERLWISINRQNLPSDMSTINRNRPLCIWDVGAAQATAIMEKRPNMIQWTGDTDGASLSETYLANLQWT